MKSTKKILLVILALVLLIGTVPSVMANDNIKVKLGGEMVEFDVPPQIINSRTMVPVRAIFEAFGASVEWDEPTRTVISTKDGKTISLTIDSSSMLVNGEAVALDSPACIVNGRTLVPVRAISEAFKATVDWDNSTQTVIISTDVKEITTMYAADGRTIEVLPSEVEAYKAVGWFVSPVITMYAADGRTIQIANIETEAYKAVGWYTEPVTTMYALDGRTLIIPTSEIEAYKAVGWYTSPILSKSAFLSKANGWWVDLSSCRMLWEDGYGLDFLSFSGDEICIGSTYSEFFEYNLKQLTFKGNNTYSATIYMPGFWYGDEYYKPESFDATIIYDGGNSLKIKFSGGSWITYTFIGTGHDFDSIQRHPLVIDAASKN